MEDVSGNNKVMRQYRDLSWHARSVRPTVGDTGFVQCSDNHRYERT